MVGAASSGKTTLIKHLNGLLKANSGTLRIDGIDVYRKKKFPSAARKKVGLVFQYPENQLFANSVLKDVTYGSLNNGSTVDDANKVATEYLTRLGIAEEKLAVNPLELSGGQQRLVALVGVLAMQPQLLVLDEPTAGLDRTAKKLLFQILHEEISQRKCAVILISHNLEDVGDYRLLKMESTPSVLRDTDLLQKADLDLPAAVNFHQVLLSEEMVTTDVPLNLAELTDQIVAGFGKEE